MRVIYIIRTVWISIKNVNHWKHFYYICVELITDLV
jgi:hypothetical protein